MFPPELSLHTKFEGFNWKIDTWPAIMHIFNEVWCSYSIPSKILTQHASYIYQTKVEIRWKEFKLSSGHRRWTDGRMDRRPDRQTDGQKEVFLELLGRS